MINQIIHQLHRKKLLIEEVLKLYKEGCISLEECIRILRTEVK